jgi:Tfp pilus assembly protein PilN
MLRRQLDVLSSATTLIAEHEALALAAGAVLVGIPAVVYLAVLRDWSWPHWRRKAGLLETAGRRRHLLDR